MIRKVTFSNFYSFGDTQEISFLAQKKHGYDYKESETGISQITKIACFIGGNASGKTNIMRLFSFLGYFVCKSKNEQDLSRLAFHTFFNNTKPSVFTIEFEIDKNIFTYNLTTQDNVVTYESLKKKSVKKYSKPIDIFTREDKNDIALNTQMFPGITPKFLKNIRSDISLIAHLHSSLSIDTIDIVYNYFSKFRTNINELGEINSTRYQDRIMKFYYQDETVRKKMETLLKQFQIGVDGIEIEKIQPPTNSQDTSIDAQIEKFRAFGVHKTLEPNKKLNFSYESRGTQSLFYAIANILYSIKHNSIIIFDEIEVGLHPEAVNKLIGYFLDENEDGKAQLIFTSHTLNIMNRLDMQQIFLVEKGKHGSSQAMKLKTRPNVRSDDNFQSKYLSGAYGAFPNIKI